MKLRFTPFELDWLDSRIKQLIQITNKSRDPDQERMNRVARKMRYKFYGNPPVVFMTGKERALINEMALVRASTLATQPTAEREIVNGILAALVNKQ